MGKGAAPAPAPNIPPPDPRIGEAALMASETGADYLEFMKEQAAITNEWAAEDRAHWETTFKPLGAEIAAEAGGYDTEARRDSTAAEAAADVSQQFEGIGGQTDRSLAAMGVDPRSGRYRAVDRRVETDEALAKAGAQNMARRGVEETGRTLKYNAQAIGQGYQVNPVTSMQTSNNAVSAGAQGAMRGYGQAADMYNTQWQQQFAGWQAAENRRLEARRASQAGMGALASGIGQIMGAAFFSSKEVKEDKRPATGVLDALRQMPVEEWRYKKGVADEGRHIGPYAEDFAAATGTGDGQTIKVQDALGVTMGAVKELDENVQDLSRKVDRALGVKEAMG